MKATAYGTGAAALLAACLWAGVVEAADPAHIRGTIGSVEGGRVTIKADDGRTVSLVLGQGWTIGGVAPAGMADITPGSFIGTANAPGGGGNEALEVVVFPEALRGTGEGDRGWDLKPGSAMTNATVAQRVDGVSGPTVTLRFRGGEKAVTIPPSTPIVRVVPATVADVKPGTKVFAAGPLSADGGMLLGGHLVVGENGATPPM